MKTSSSWTWVGKYPKIIMKTKTSSKGKMYWYKCRRCGKKFMREPFGYKDYTALCDGCFRKLLEIKVYEDYVNYIKNI